VYTSNRLTGTYGERGIKGQRGRQCRSVFANNWQGLRGTVEEEAAGDHEVKGSSHGNTRSEECRCNMAPCYGAGGHIDS